MIRNHRLTVYFDLGRSKGINKMNALAAKLKGNSFYGKMIKDLDRHELTKSTHEERVVDKALRISFFEINMCLQIFQDGQKRPQGTLRPRRCVTKQCAWSHTHWNLYQTILKCRRCAMRQRATTRSIFSCS